MGTIVTTANREEIAQALRLLTQPGQTVELRALVKNSGETKPHMEPWVSNDFEALTDRAVAQDSRAVGTYITLNPIRKDLQGSARDSDVLS